MPRMREPIVGVVLTTTSRGARSPGCSRRGDGDGGAFDLTRRALHAGEEQRAQLSVGLGQNLRRRVREILCGIGERVDAGAERRRAEGAR